MTHLDEKQLALVVAEYYCNLMDRGRKQLPRYLVEDVVLDWFGRTISGKDQVASFIIRDMVCTTHKLMSIEPAGPIEYRGKLKNKSRSCNDDDDCVSAQEKCVKSLKNLTMDSYSANLESCLEKLNPTFSPKRSTNDDSAQKSRYKAGNLVVQVQGDCLTSFSAHCSKYFEACGHVEFCRTKQSPSTTRNLKLTADTMKWERYCKVHVTYSFSCNQGDIRDRFEIGHIIYDDNLRCKRNLAPEFDKLAFNNDIS